MDPIARETIRKEIVKKKAKVNQLRRKKEQLEKQIENEELEIQLLDQSLEHD